MSGSDPYLAPLQDRVAVACGCAWVFFGVAVAIADGVDYWPGFLPVVAIGYGITAAVAAIRRRRNGPAS